MSLINMMEENKTMVNTILSLTTDHTIFLNTYLNDLENINAQITISTDNVEQLLKTKATLEEEANKITDDSLAIVKSTNTQLSELENKKFHAFNDKLIDQLESIQEQKISYDDNNLQYTNNFNIKLKEILNNVNQSHDIEEKLKNALDDMKKMLSDTTTGGFRRKRTNKKRHSKKRGGQSKKKKYSNRKLRKRKGARPTRRPHRRNKKYGKSK
jgi:hypothetical protein